MSEEKRLGFYRDKDGVWQVDCRKGDDRRARNTSHQDHERRSLFRRHADRELYERDHRLMIEEALGDFAEEHDGRL